MPWWYPVKTGKLKITSVSLKSSKLSLCNNEDVSGKQTDCNLITSTELGDRPTP